MKLSKKEIINTNVTKLYTAELLDIIAEIIAYDIMKKMNNKSKRRRK